MSSELNGWEADKIRAACGPLPLYNSPEWWRLDEDDPRRLASVVRAAACWRREGEPDVIAERLRREMAEQDRAVLGRWKDAACDVSEATDWPARASEPTHALLQRRRAT